MTITSRTNTGWGGRRIITKVYLRFPLSNNCLVHPVVLLGLYCCLWILSLVSYVGKGKQSTVAFTLLLLSLHAIHFMPRFTYIFYGLPVGHVVLGHAIKCIKSKTRAD